MAGNGGLRGGILRPPARRGVVSAVHRPAGSPAGLRGAFPGADSREHSQQTVFPL